MEKITTKQVRTNKSITMKTVPGFERYMVSFNGDRVYDTITKQNLPIYQDDKGYQFIYDVWSSEGIKLKDYPLHRFVAYAFVPMRKDCNIVHHIDENPSNNDMNNLIWVDNKTHLFIHQYLYKNGFRIIK